MTKDEALKMAIEHIERNYHDEKFVINACKEALEQPAQEPVAYNFEGVLFFANEASHYMKDSGQPLYTHPHQWQGLTDDEIWELVSEIDVAGEIESLLADFGRMIEQALKEKNANNN